MEKGWAWVQTEVGPVRFPRGARTPRQRVAWLLRRGYTWAAFALARHSGDILMFFLKRHDDMWKNSNAAWRHGAPR